MNHSWAHLLIWSGVGIGGLLLLAVLALYFWPTSLPNLRTAPAHPDMTYEEAVQAANDRVARDTADTNVMPECRSKFLLQPIKTAKVVVLFHGYVACPQQMAGLAATMFAQGYTVYVPRAPIHGEYDHQKLMSPDAFALVKYASDAASIVKALSPDAGAIGLSGGGVLTGWVAAYRPDAIKHVAILDPFFEPAAAKAPKWKLPLLLRLYGLTHLAPNVPDGPHGSYRGLAAYMLIVRNTPSSPLKQATAALILSPGDVLTDLNLSRKRFSQWFPGQAIYQTPSAWGFEHDNLSMDLLGSHAAEAYADYQRAYEHITPVSLTQ